MTRLQQSQFDCPGNLEEIIIWGISPIKQLINFMDIYIEENLNDEDQDAMVFSRYEFENKINDIEEAIYRAIKELKKKQGKPELKEVV